MGIKGAARLTSGASTMAKPDGANVEFVYYLEPGYEWITLGNGKKRLRGRIRRHRIAKMNTRWVHVEHDPYPDDGSVPPPDKKCRTFLLSRFDLDMCGAAYRRDKLPDHETYYVTAQDAIAHNRPIEPPFDPDAWLAEYQDEVNRSVQAFERFVQECEILRERLRRGRSVACFTVLGIKPGTSVEEIKSAFRRLSLERHPDVGGDQNSFIQLRQAYEQALRLTTMNSRED
jgi:hypothetical protein